MHGGSEADASLKRLTAPGVVQFEAQMVEVLAACYGRHKAPSLLALHALSCYPTRLISPAAQRRAILLGPRSRWVGAVVWRCQLAVLWVLNRHTERISTKSRTAITVSAIAHKAREQSTGITWPCAPLAATKDGSGGGRGQAHAAWGKGRKSP